MYQGSVSRIKCKQALIEPILIKQGVHLGGKIYELLRSMYQGSVSRIKCKQALIEPILIKQGVHQGNVLSPLLFNIFINDIGNDDAPILHDSKISHLLYADVWLQRNMDRVYEFCKNWGLAVNIDR